MKCLFPYSLLLSFSLLALLAGSPAFAQPHNSFGNASVFAANETISTTLCGPQEFFAKTLLPGNGTVSLAVAASNTGSNSGYVYVYVYDARQSGGLLFAGYVATTSIGAGQSVSDTIVLRGLLADSLHIRFTAVGCYNLTASYQLTNAPANDAEPNNSILQAGLLAAGSTAAGHVGFLRAGVPDADDYYYSILPDNGSLQISVAGTNASARNGYLYLYVYDRRQLGGQLLADYVQGTNAAAGQTVTDTFVLRGRASDTVYFRLIASTAFQYQLGYRMTDVPIADAEPNNSFASATPFAAAQTQAGIIGYYRNGGADEDDYYATRLPQDGAMRIFVSATNRDSKRGFVYMYGYDKRKAGGTRFASYVGKTTSVAVGATVLDTITVPGQLADSFFVRLTSSAAFSYQFRYEMIQDAGSEDPEPNNSFDEAVMLNSGLPQVGRIGYAAGAGIDEFDFFAADLPGYGTMRVIVNGTNQGSGNGYLYLRVYDNRRNSGQLLAQYVGSTNVVVNGSVTDTFYVYGRQSGRHFMRIESSRAFNYSIQYDLMNAVPEDPEPNADTSTAIPLPENSVLEGNIGYLNNGTDDASDFYRLELAENGTLHIRLNGSNNGNAGGYVYVNVYDSRGTGGQVAADYMQATNILANGRFADSIVLRGRRAGTYFIRITSVGSFGYTVSYALQNRVPQDEEPNNVLSAAQPAMYGQWISGNIGYLQAGAADGDDYFAGQLPAFGTLRIMLRATHMGSGNGWLYHYGYDGRKMSGQIFARYIKGTSHVPGTTITDTFTVSCRAIDSFYHRITSLGAWQYEWSYELLNTTTPEQTANQTFATATALPLGTTATDNIGYTAAGSTDANDYYVTRKPGRGSIRYIVQATSTSAGNGWLYAYVYEKRSAASPVLATGRFLGGGSALAAGTSFTDTLVFDCSSFDSVYFLMTSSGCWRYTVRPEFVDRDPVVKATYERMGNEFGFRAEQKNADVFNWRFSDTLASSSLAIPMRSYLPGSYSVRLIGQNGVCPAYRDTSVIAFDVFGVEYFTPDKGAAGGEAALTIFGGGLDSTTQVKLSRNGTELRPRATHGNSLRNKLTAEFDLHFADEGVYDVSIMLPGIDTLFYPQSFTVSSFQYPYTTARIVAPALWRTGVQRTLQLSVENHGNVTATGVRVGVVWPRGMEVNWGELLRLPSTGIDSVPNGSGGWYTVPRSSLNVVYDSVQTTTAISVFQGRPYDGFIRFFYVPHVPANASVEFPFKAKATSSARHPMIAFSMHPNLFGSCGNEAQADMEDLMQAEILDFADDFADKTKVPPFKAFVKTAKVGSKHMGSASSYFGKKFWAWYDGYEFNGDAAMADLIKETEVNNKYAVETAVKEVADLVGSKAIDKAGSAIESRVSHINKRLAANPNMSTETFDKYLDLLNSTSDQSKRVELLEKMFTNVKAGDKALRRAESLAKLAKDCPELLKQLEELQKNADSELNHQNTNTNTTETRTSFDPNDIFGPVGFNTQRYVNNKDVQHFSIAFENIATAGADAQLVVIRDTLDKAVFDLDAFEFGSISIGGRYISVPAGRRQLVLQRRVNDSIDVRINARLDTASGEALWVFTAIDRRTGDLPDFAGFLPPNQSSPEGEGYVDYKLKPRSHLPHLTVLRSRASIYFDQNAPIATSTWQNIIDLAPPSSTLSATRTGDTTVRVSIQGLDAHAGTAGYQVYVSENNKAWTLLSKQAGDSLLFEGRLDSTYRFYVTGLDSLRNEEPKAPVAEAVITLNNPLPVSLLSFGASADGSTNRLQWTTASESNNRGFVVERSADGRQFTAMGFVPSLAPGGHSQQLLQYSFADRQPLEKTYYRLRQTDLDGRTQLSGTVLVQRASGGSLHIAPNPVGRWLNISSPQAVKGVRLLDMQGRVLQAFAPASSGQYPLRPLSAGMYLVQIDTADGVITKKIQVLQ